MGAISRRDENEPSNDHRKICFVHVEGKGKLEDSEVKPHLLVSMIVEMMLDGNLEITDKNKVKITSISPITPYNKQLYEIIGEMKKMKYR